MDSKIEQLDDRLLLINLYLTQGIALCLGAAGFYFFNWRAGEPAEAYFGLQDGWKVLGLAVLCAGIVLALELALVNWLPRTYFDDGGINEKLFSQRPIWHILIIAAIVSFSEELLFRVVIQNQIGLMGASLLFSLVHIRYIKKWVMFATVFFVSLALGILYDYAGTAIAPMLSHFLIDFVLACFIRFEWIKN